MFFKRYILLFTQLLMLLFPISVSSQVAKYSVVIHELLPDPLPSKGLPSSEFVELRNVSSLPVNLKNWKLTDGSSTATINISYTLQPDSIVILCPSSAAASFSAFGPTIGLTSFPSLNNDADIILLLSPSLQVIHVVAYDISWFNNVIKSEGGWSLEMIDSKNPCSGVQNWKCSEDPSGGTPGKMNSVRNNNPDLQPPAIERTYSIDSLSVVVVFSESLDSFSAVNPIRYTFHNFPGTCIKALPVAPLFKEVKLILSIAMEPGVVYDLEVKEVTDCAGNKISDINHARAGKVENCDSLDIVLNEILFNPVSAGYDYVELYNRSEKILDASQLYLANRDQAGLPANSARLSAYPFLIFPGDYFLITEDPDWVSRNYFFKNLKAFSKVSNLPSLPDDEGNCLLVNNKGNIVDDCHYSEKWHFSLLSKKEGVALERIDPENSTNSSNNWTSAAASVGFGSPGMLNSQNKVVMNGSSRISVQPAVFSPDNDGRDDLCIISYELDRPGYLMSVTVFDINGHLVKKLIQQETIAGKGFLRWDGTSTNGNRAPTGLYLILTDLFNIDGKRSRYKNAVALASRN